MKYAYLILLLLFGLILSVRASIGATPDLSHVQNESLKALLRSAEQFESEGDDVSAYLFYIQAKELESYWQVDAKQTDNQTSEKLDAHLKKILSPESNALTKLLNSDQLTAEQKRALLKKAESTLIQ